MIILIVFIGLAVYILISGIRLYITAPKPPSGGNFRDYYSYYDNLENGIEIELENDNTQEIKIYKEIDFHRAQIAMLEDLQRIIEDELHTESGNYKANLSRLISIDKQIHNTQKKIDKLLESLE
jgi:hypothetical protein